MATTFTKTETVIINPFDDGEETVIEVSGIVAAGISRPGEKYSFSLGTSDEDIRAAVEADLAAKGYAI